MKHLVGIHPELLPEAVRSVMSESKDDSTSEESASGAGESLESVVQNQCEHCGHEYGPCIPVSLEKLRDVKEVQGTLRQLLDRSESVEDERDQLLGEAEEAQETAGLRDEEIAVLEKARAELEELLRRCQEDSREKSHLKESGSVAALIHENATPDEIKEKALRQAHESTRAGLEKRY